jgi:hypothetical protein
MKALLGTVIVLIYGVAVLASLAVPVAIVWACYHFITTK